MTDPIVDITDVFADAYKAPAHTLQPGDVVFDVFGEPHALARVTRFKRVTRIRRADGHTDTFDNATSITRIPKEALDGP